MDRCLSFLSRNRLLMRAKEGLNVREKLCAVEERHVLQIHAFSGIDRLGKFGDDLQSVWK